MGLGGALILLVGGALAFANVVTTRRLWRSPIFETSQKVAQTVLMWLIPGSVFVVWNLLREPRFGGDATTGGAAFVVTDWLLGGPGESLGSGGHHAGSDGGGHHDGTDGGGHHGADGGHGGSGGFDGGGGSGGDGGGGGP